MGLFKIKPFEFSLNLVLTVVRLARTFAKKQTMNSNESRGSDPFRLHESPFHPLDDEKLPYIQPARVCLPVLDFGPTKEPTLEELHQMTQTISADPFD
jgi:hypothetical protein